MCNLSWTIPLLDKDDSTINPVYNSQNMSAHSIGRRKGQVLEILKNKDLVKFG